MPKGRKKVLAEPAAEEKAVTEEIAVTESSEQTAGEAVTEEQKEAVPAAEVISETPKRRGRKPGAKNKPKETKAVPEEKAASKTAKPLTAKTNVYVEHMGNQYNTEDIIASIQAAWVAEKHRAGSIKTLDVYIKPEEGKAYYVINDKKAGYVSI